MTHPSLSTLRVRYTVAFIQLISTNFILSTAAITLTIVAATTNSILIQWDVIEEAQGSIMPSGYNISYRNIEYTDCFTKSDTISIPTDSLGGSNNIDSLEEGTDYSITVALLVDGAVTDRNTVLQATAEAGKCVYVLMEVSCLVCLSLPQLRLPLHLR